MDVSKVRPKDAQIRLRHLKCGDAFQWPDQLFIVLCEKKVAIEPNKGHILCARLTDGHLEWIHPDIMVIRRDDVFLASP